MARLTRNLLASVWILAACFVHSARGEVVEHQAKETLTALEMDRGDELRFTLQDGRVFTLVLEDTEASIIERVTPGGIVYRFAAAVRVDGQPMALERFVCTQESFYAPYVIDGVRIWLDTVRDVFELIPIRYPREGNLRCLPRKDARLAVQDARLRICPQELQPWIEEDENSIDVGKCYNGDDCYLGPYLGQACHVGMDINQARGSVLRAPIDFDTQAYFNSLVTGDNNNRWRGIRRWENGDVWALQTHHLIDLLVPENQPLKAGTRYATTAGVHVGSHEHTHFEFKLGPISELEPDEGVDQDPTSIAVPIDFDDQSAALNARPQVLHLDPWIIFWQIFEDRRRRQGDLRAAIVPFGPGQTGATVRFSANRSPTNSDREACKYYWTFGDGVMVCGPTVKHVFVRPGVHPVTLVVDDGVHRDATTQHISISGLPVDLPALVLSAPDACSFRKRPLPALDVYGRPPQSLPHTLQFVTRTEQPASSAKTVRIDNGGTGELDQVESVEIDYQVGANWLHIVRAGTGNIQSLQASVDATGLGLGTYVASVQVTCAGAINSPQCFGVQLHVTGERDTTEVIVDNEGPGFYATPYFWVGHRFCRCPKDKRGHGGSYLTNGGRPAAGQFARFTPNLQAGQYEVLLSEKTPFAPDVEFDVRVCHSKGDQTIRVQPHQSRTIGSWSFAEGTDGFVEILPANSRGLVIADAIAFRRIGPQYDR